MSKGGEADYPTCPERERCPAYCRDEPKEEVKEDLSGIVARLVAPSAEAKTLSHVGARPIPALDSVERIISDLESILYPGYFGSQDTDERSLAYRIGYMANRVRDNLADQIAKSLSHECPVRMDTCDECKERGHRHAAAFMKKLPDIRDELAQDIQAAYACDPAAKSIPEIIFSYPCVKAIAIHRMAHELWVQGVPILPRIMSEVAHTLAGIDIHPGATIGRRFFIDHGTGVVIGETSVIGDNVTLYQGVTLGGSGSHTLKRDAQGDLIRSQKRHPTIEDNVTIYSGATVLGGDTVIGRNCTIGGNVWLTESVPPNTIVTLEKPTLRYRNDTNRGAKASGKAE